MPMGRAQDRTLWAFIKRQHVFFVATAGHARAGLWPGHRDAGWDAALAAFLAMWPDGLQDGWRRKNARTIHGVDTGLLDE